MVVCYKFFYKQKKPDESDADRLSRRISFKLPIVLRYSIGLSVFFGLVHLTFSRQIRHLRNHILVMPLYMIGLCHEEIYQLFCIKTGKPVVWRQRGKNLYEEQLRQKARQAEQAQEMKIQAKILSQQLQKPLNAEL